MLGCTLPRASWGALRAACHPFVDDFPDFAERGEHVHIKDLAPEGPVETSDAGVLRGFAGLCMMESHVWAEALGVPQNTPSVPENHPIRGRFQLSSDMLFGRALPLGFEQRTHGLEGRCSNPLSYGSRPS